MTSTEGWAGLFERLGALDRLGLGVGLGVGLEITKSKISL